MLVIFITVHEQSHSSSSVRLSHIINIWNHFSYAHKMTSNLVQSTLQLIY